MICPKCGEDNSANFRYCGMCGTALERRPAGSPRVAGAVESGRSVQSDSTNSRASYVSNTTVATDHPVPPTAGPSFLGLNDVSADASAGRQSSADAVRDHFFSNSPTLYEPDEPNIGARRVVLLLVLLAILGAGGWWAYSNYGKTRVATRSSQAAPATPPTSSSSANPSSSPDASSSQPVTPSASPAPQSQAPVAEQNAQPKPAEKGIEKTNPKRSEVAKSAEPTRPSRPATVVRGDRTPAQRPSPAVAADDKGNAEFRRGEAYLYGRGMPENCGQAIKDLKAASAKQNSKARSTFGTMYATGHCVARDLPTSYTWFASALRADPNNQILEKDLVAIWNQMTPPERQMATKSKEQ